MFIWKKTNDHVHTLKKKKGVMSPFPPTPPKRLLYTFNPLPPGSSKKAIRPPLYENLPPPLRIFLFPLLTMLSSKNILIDYTMTLFPFGMKRSKFCLLHWAIEKSRKKIYTQAIPNTENFHFNIHFAQFQKRAILYSLC